MTTSGSAVMRSTWVRAILLAGLLYLFFLGLDLMGLSFKLFGKGFAEQLIAHTTNPFVGLLIGILATTLVQSSSTTTSMTVALVAAGALTIEGAIPIVMGANIGTSVTNTLVSLAHASRPEEFRRAFAGATVHDFFNWITVIVLLPVEIVFGYLEKTATFLESVLEGAGGIKLFDPLKAIVRPVAEAVSAMLGKSGALTLVAGVLLLFFALKFLVDFLKVVFSSRAESILHRTLFRSALVSMGAGMVITVMVQSSSITTSVAVPLVGAGIVTLEQVFPFTIGANVGTTVTAMLAALATGDPAAVSVAFSHLLFNLSGTAIVYPLKPIRRIPLRLARTLGNVGARSRVLAIAYIATLFYGLPFVALLASGALARAVEPAAPSGTGPAPRTSRAWARPAPERPAGAFLKEHSDV